jgi:radical SAM superfamily enzyme YgiQ (UPF0313 family)
MLQIVSPGSTGKPASATTKPGLVTLISPSRVTSTNIWSVPFTVPLGLGYIASVLRREGVEVKAIDGFAANYDKITIQDGYRIQGLSNAEVVDLVDPNSQIIGVSCMFSQEWLNVRDLFTRLRERFPQAILVAGGEHASAVSECVLRTCPAVDVCVRGEGEETMAELATRPLDRATWRSVHGLAFLDGDEYVVTPPRARIREVDDIPWPAWDIFPMDAYLQTDNMYGVNRGRTIGILATRGCPYKCTFCSNPSMYGKVWEARDPKLLMDEIEHYINTYGVQNCDFYDLTMVLKKEWILEFCREIDRRGLKFYWQLPAGTRSEIIDDEVSAALYSHGCKNLTFAPESGSPDVLHKIKKKVDLKRMETAIRAALRNKIRVKLNIIVGFPQETRRDAWKTIFWCWKMAVIGVDAAETFLFTPYPGTELFDGLQKDGTIPALDDSYFKSLVAFLDPFLTSRYCKHITPRELSFYRGFNMLSFFAISFALRPWRLLKLIPNVLRNRSETVIEHRLGVWFHMFVKRFSRKTEEQQAAVGSATST